MAHREQHTNREAKKPKKDKPKDGSQGSRSKWVVNEAVEAKRTKSTRSGRFCSRVATQRSALLHPAF